MNGVITLIMDFMNGYQEGIYQFHSLIVLSYNFKEIPPTLKKNKPQEDSQRVGLSRDTACTVLTGSCVPSLWRVTFPGRNKRLLYLTISIAPGNRPRLRGWWR